MKFQKINHYVILLDNKLTHLKLPPPQQKNIHFNPTYYLFENLDTSKKNFLNFQKYFFKYFFKISRKYIPHFFRQLFLG